MNDEPLWVTIIPVLSVIAIVIIGLTIMGGVVDFKIETLKQVCLGDITIADKNFCENQVYTAYSAGTYHLPAGNILITDVVTT